MISRKYAKSRELGAAAIELALLSIPFVLMVLALVDFARAMFVYDQLVKAARDGARYMAIFDPSDSNYPVAKMKQRILYGQVAGTSMIVPGLTAEMIHVCDRVNASACPGDVMTNVVTGSGVINLVEVRISGYQFTPVFPAPAWMKTVTFDPISVTMRQL
jgi:Flp pilus assembly protein TadG